ncbi:MAG TPA: cellulose-binding protein [Candidatus Sericytochromatia bacterium]
MSRIRRFTRPSLFAVLGLLLSWVISCASSSLPAAQTVPQPTSIITPSVTSTAINAIATTSANSPSNKSLGMGLAGIADWSTQIPFLNLFKQARPWNWDNKTPNLDLDANGYPKSLKQKIETPLMAGKHPLMPGRYVVLYEGEGTFDFFGASINQSLSKPGRQVIDVNPGTEIVVLRLVTTNPNNHIRNIAVVKEKYEKLYQAGEVFNPDFIAKIKDFDTLRFMDWMGTNNSEQKDWQNRPKPTDYSWAKKGVPVEVMVALCNKLKVNAWFNMPHLASDDYITKFAQYVKANLDPSLKAYVEYSNEAWNWQFQQSQYGNVQGRAKWPDRGDAWMQWNGMKSAQICDIWKKQVFGEKEKNRVACVMGTQTAWRGLEESVLQCPSWAAEGHEPCYKHGIDALAITGYFSGDLGQQKNVEQVLSWRKDPDGGFEKAFTQLTKGGVLKDSKDTIQTTIDAFAYFQKVAQSKNLKLVAYEGGSHIVGIGDAVKNDQLTEFLIAINKHPRMYDIYTEIFNGWKKAGGTLFNQFVDVGQPTKWGSWGALDYVTQETSPKYKALLDFMGKNPKWWN